VISEIEDYFAKGCGRCKRFGTPDCSARRWAPGLQLLRQICREAGLVETVKWGHPCYQHAGRNIAIIGALRGDFRLSFFNAALMADPEGVLEKAGSNTRNPDMIRFASVSEVERLAPIIGSYLREAMSHAEAGTKPPREEAEVILPEELIEALDRETALAEAFSGLTPGRQRSYVLNLMSTKSTATRRNRIAKFRDKILAGKGANER
jgi:uncharacterized protein YdeI (YjbR/CyaY-like superfamily)